MADEITISSSVRVKNGTAPNNTHYFRQEANQRIDQSANTSCGGTPSIGTAAEALPVTDVSTCGVSFFKNVDATNYVEVGMLDGSTNSAFAAFLKIEPGEAYVVRLGTNAPYAKANSSAVKLEYMIHSD